MRAARYGFTLGVFMLVASGLVLDYFQGGLSAILLAGGLGAVVGSVNAFLGAVNNGK